MRERREQMYLLTRWMYVKAYRYCAVETFSMLVSWIEPRSRGQHFLFKTVGLPERIRLRNMRYTAYNSWIVFYTLIFLRLSTGILAKLRKYFCVWTLLVSAPHIIVGRRNKSSVALTIRAAVVS